ncbi:MAG: glycoside hydrolase family 38 N-terminal domain-containing protein [Planctomycetota bacterium]
MKKNRIHLVCNAHIDPVWLWEWEEGAAVALSTFRTAADLCEEFDGFVFNHNEAILYHWVEEFEPALFRRIRRLVKQGRWHVMGGWFLQPDCNMPSGESFVRQILEGRRYFQEKFGAKPTAGVNLDPFGHTRGLVQILAKSGYDAYLFCRPSLDGSPLPAPEFVWLGYDGSRILGTLAQAHYNSSHGKARSRVEEWMAEQKDKTPSMLLWGVGDHGGGPSRVDLKALAELMGEQKKFKILHSTPETYFRELEKREKELPLHEGDINPFAVGCYTSMVRIKQKHRALENALFMTEKMAAAAAFQGFMKYPKEAIREACRDLLFSQFHDILPGSSIPEVEESAIRCMDHGLEILSRLKARAFFALASGQKKALAGTIPILVYNPHPFPIKTVIECELEQEEPNYSGTFLRPEVYKGWDRLSSQAEKESSNINQDFRKRVVFRALLEPAQMNRFDCRLSPLPAKPAHTLESRNDLIHFRTRYLDVKINARTGLMDRYRVRGKDYLKPDAFMPLVMQDNQDAWGLNLTRFRKKAGRFRLMPEADGMRFSGMSEGRLPSVRVIEDGPVRSVVEALFAYNDSFLCQQYKLPKVGTEIEVVTRVFWNERSKMLKLSIPTTFTQAEYRGQVAYGTAPLKNNGDEMVAQRWVGAICQRRRLALTCINCGTYGSDMTRGEIRMSLLRSPAYSALPVEGKAMVEQDRFIPHMDQGERVFRFWVNGGPVDARMEAVESEALVKNEAPFALPFFPQGRGKKPKPFIKVSDPAVQITAVKKAERSNGLIIRLFEPTGRTRKFLLSLPFAPAKTQLQLSGFEIKTLRFERKSKRFIELDLLEKKLGGRRA